MSPFRCLDILSCFLGVIFVVFFGIFSIEQLLRRTDVDKDGFLRTVVNALPLYSFGCPRTLESGGQLGTQHKNLHKKAHF